VVAAAIRRTLGMIGRPSAALAALVLVSLAGVGSARAATYYVSTSGSDSSPGSSAAPLRTLQKAASKVAAGDTVIVRPGSYAGFHLTRSGVAGAEIRFAAQPGVTITSRNPVTPDGINLEGASHVRVEGFAVVGMPRAGLRAVNCHHVTLRNNRADRNYKWGILTGWCSDSRIERNETSRSQTQHGIYLGNSGDRNLVRGNVSWGNYQIGIHLNGDKNVGGGDGIMSGLRIEDNILFGNGAGGGAAINCDGVQGSTIRNNLIYDNRATGIALFRIDGGGPSSGNRIVNNTILNASSSRWVILLRDGAVDNVLRNNVLWSDHSYRGAILASPDSLPGLSSNHNAVIGRFARDGSGSTVLSLAQWQSATGQDRSSLVATPTQLFVSPASHDYELRAGSPAIDRGTSSYAPTRDLDGTPRPQGAAHDIGALEYCAGGCLAAAGLEVEREDDVGAEDGDDERGDEVGGCSAASGGGSALVLMGILVGSLLFCRGGTRGGQSPRPRTR
jgi:hypothetical protein